MIAEAAGPHSGIDDDLRLRRKIDLIIAKFGPELLSIPIEELRRMTDEAADVAGEENVFRRMWDEFRFIPSGRWIRRLGNAEAEDLQAIADVMEAVWGE